VVVLDPGLSFGTGQHPTTAFCLEQLVARRSSKERQSLLDLGTGSGILAIAAAKLGYKPISALDFDAEAVRVARVNARRNRVADRIRFSRRDLTRMPRRAGRTYAVVCANLLADLLLAERERILARLQPVGLLVLAGILKTEFAAVQAAYEAAGLRLVASRAEKEWRSGGFTTV
jgi:ribosomal protein L11 methyltransferase